MLSQFINNEKRLVWSLFGGAFLIRLSYGLAFFSIYGTDLFVDDWDYISYAKQIISQGLLVPDIDQIITNGHQVGVGWPLIISFSISLFGENYWPIVILNAIFSALHVLLLYKIACFVFDKRVALITVLLSIFYIRFIKYVPFVQKECLIHFSFAATIYLFLKSLKSPSTKEVMWFAITYLLFLHIDERYLVFAPLYVFLYLITGRYEIRLAIRKSIFLTLIVSIGVIPWTIRNASVYGRPILLAYQTSAFTDFLFKEMRDQFYDGKPTQKTPYSRKNLKTYETIVQRIYNGKDINAYKKEYKYVSSIKKSMKDGYQPRTYSWEEGKMYELFEFFRISRFRGGYTANGYRFFYPWKSFNNIVYIFCFGVPFVFMIASLFYKEIYLTNFTLVLFTIIVIYSLVHVLLVHGIVRYRVPIDGFIFIFSSFTISKILRRIGV